MFLLISKCELIKVKRTAGSFLSSTQINVFLYQGSLIREGFLAEVSIVQLHAVSKVSEKTFDSIE